MSSKSDDKRDKAFAAVVQAFIRSKLDTGYSLEEAKQSLHEIIDEHDALVSGDGDSSQDRMH